MGHNFIEKESVYEETEKRSKFISYSFIINDVTEARENLQKIKSLHHSARHHVYAYVLKEGMSEKYSDDGEPSGTGGLPIMTAIKNLDLVNIMVIVVRYFGGILLGTGGLRRMYSSGAVNVLNKSGIVKMSICSELFVECGYKEYGQILNIISEFGGKLRKLDYNSKVSLIFYLKKEFTDLLIKKIEDITRGNSDLKVLSESYQNI